MLLPKRKVTFAIFAIIIVILWRIILRWGRAYARLLEADALNFLRNDDGPMVGLFVSDCFLFYCMSRK